MLYKPYRTILLNRQYLIMITTFQGQAHALVLNRTPHLIPHIPDSIPPKDSLQQHFRQDSEYLNTFKMWRKCWHTSSGQSTQWPYICFRISHLSSVYRILRTQCNTRLLGQVVCLSTVPLNSIFQFHLQQKHLPSHLLHNFYSPKSLLQDPHLLP